MNKQTKATIVAVSGAIGLIVGLLADAPQAIQNAGKWLPQWLKHPDFWWVGGVIAVTGFVLWLIWRRPTDEENKDRRSVFIPAGLSDDRLLDRMNASSDAITEAFERHRNMDEMNAEIEHQLQEMLPAFIETAFTKSERVAYDAALQQALQNRNKRKAFRIMMNWLWGRITVRRKKLYLQEEKAMLRELERMERTGN